MDQQIRFCSTATGRIAYAEVGVGPALVLPAWWVSHLELDWERADFRVFIEALAARRRVIRYDRVGSGLSDRRRDGGTAASTASSKHCGRGRRRGARTHRPARDLERSLPGCRLRRARPGLPSRRWCSTAAMPGRRGHCARGARLDAGRGERTLGARLTATGRRVSARREAPRSSRPSPASSAQAAPPETAAAHLGFVYSVDVSAELAQIDAPTLVLHRREDRAIPFELGRELATSVQGRPSAHLGGQPSTCPGAATPPRSPPP